MSWSCWRARTRDVPLPAAFVDLDALERNLDVLLERLSPEVTLRLATKSIRVPALLPALLQRPQLRGLMTWSAHETALLAEQGFDDLLLAYPVARATDAAWIATAAEKATVRVVVDELAHAQLLSRAAVHAGVQIGLCLEIDVALRVAGQHLGVLRSPLRTPTEAVAVAAAMSQLPQVRVDAVMAYEAQVAGLPDVGSPRPIAMVEQLVKSRSRPLAARRRRAVVQALRDAGHDIVVVNGGGTGSVRSTSHDGTVTEVAAGSGLFCPRLFDGYHDLPLQPAAFFALPVVRRPDPRHVVCFSGGYVASGPPGASRVPEVVWPAGLTPLPREGFGEVQTPLRVGADCPELQLGDPVVCRHAKAGELMEHVGEVHLCRGDAIVDTVPTLRGLGTRFG